MTTPEKPVGNATIHSPGDRPRDVHLEAVEGGFLVTPAATPVERDTFDDGIPSTDHREY